MDFITILALIVASMLKYSAPLIFTSIGGTFSERGGIVNVGLEGIMVIGAFAGVLFNLNFADSFGDATPWIAAIVAGLIGLVYSLLHAVATINFRELDCSIFSSLSDTCYLWCRPNTSY